MKFIFRCDSSLEIGTGHVVRCLTLADSIRLRGAEVEFISRELKGNIIAEIERRGFVVHKLPYKFIERDDASLLETSHSQWLGVPLNQEIEEIQRVLSNNALLDWLIVDHYALDSVWEQVMRRYAKRIMVIDDLADRKHDCDILLDQNLYENMGTRYDNLVAQSCVKFLGPKYSLLRPEFVKARNGLRKRDGNVHRIVVFFGGADKTNETTKALDAIILLNQPNIEIDVIVGASNPHAESIRKRCKEISNCNYYYNISTMAEVMAKADLAIGAGGTSTWERCCLGLPSLIVSVADNQKQLAEDAHRIGYAIYIVEHSSVSAEILFQTLRQTLHNNVMLNKMSKKCFEITDAHGVERISDKLLLENF